MRKVVLAMMTTLNGRLDGPDAWVTGVSEDHYQEIDRGYGTFDTILVLTGGGPGTATLTPALYSYARAFQTNDWPVGAASGWLIALGVIAVGAVYLRLARERQST